MFLVVLRGPDVLVSIGHSDDDLFPIGTGSEEPTQQYDEDQTFHTITICHSKDSGNSVWVWGRDVYNQPTGKPFITGFRRRY